MPNHCVNRVRLYLTRGADAATVAASLQSEARSIDFEVIIPPPENMFRGDLGKAEEERCAAEGIPTWYRWQIDNWGTKWNAYSQEEPVIDDDVIELVFSTAWGPPMPIIERLRSWPGVDSAWGHYVIEFGEGAGVF